LLLVTLGRRRQSRAQADTVCGWDLPRFLVARSGMSGAVAGDRLLDLLEYGWRRALEAGTVAGQLDVEPGLAQAVATALGEQSLALAVGGVAEKWPARVIVGLARIAGEADTMSLSGTTSFWPTWHRATGLRASGRSAREWGSAFLAALGALGLQPAGSTADDAVRAHAATPGDQNDAGGGDGEDHLRLDPFGGGVSLTDADSGQARAVLPEEIAGQGGRLLAFDENGALVGGALPAEAVWVLCPAGAEPRSDAPLRILVTSRLPLTWRGWRLIQLDLRGASWLALSAAESGADGGRRVVRGRTKPVLRTGLPIPGVTTVTGKPVFASPPEVLLPPGRAAFLVEARRPESGTVLASVTAIGDDWRPDALWRKAKRPLLGEMTVTVTPGLRRTIVLAEGLRVTSHPAPRLTSARGLQPAEAVISALPGMTVSPAAVAYQQETVTRQITCVAGPVVQRLAVTPPHIRMRVDPEPGSGGTLTGWHHAGPLRLTQDDLWRGGLLRVDLPGVAVTPSITITAGDTGAEPVQVLDPTRDGRYPLRRILDTVAIHGDAELAITIAGAGVTIATVSGTTQVNDPWTMT
jgi:hypothetical protein